MPIMQSRWRDPTYALALWQLCGAILFFIASTCNLFPQFEPGTRTHMVIIATPFLLGGCVETEEKPIFSMGPGGGRI